MRWLITTVAFLMMLGPVAMAQNNNPKPSSNQPATREAPVGHRQPRADQFPSEKSLSDPNNPENREDAALDRKIKSICRGC
jgi:hypothetical protein